MPLSTIQEDVLRLIAANRSPDSYVAGATVLQRAEDTPRYSADLDLFHDLGILKRRWLGALERARALVAELPPDEVGCLYVDANRQPARPDPTSDEFRALTRHRGCVRGAWPSVSPYRHP